MIEQPAIFERIVVLLRDMRTFQTRLFKAGDEMAEQSALVELEATVRKHGLTKDEILQTWRIAGEHNPTSGEIIKLSFL